MIVNCFQIFRTIRVRHECFNFDDGHGDVLMTNPDDIDRIVGALASTFEWTGELGDNKCVAATQIILNGCNDIESSYLTVAEYRLVLTIYAWLAAELGATYEDGWGMKTLATSRFIFENHNRAVGILLHRAGVKKG